MVRFRPGPGQDRGRYTEVESDNFNDFIVQMNILHDEEGYELRQPWRSHLMEDGTPSYFAVLERD
jgi:hypothetical protein